MCYGVFACFRDGCTFSPPCLPSYAWARAIGPRWQKRKGKHEITAINLPMKRELASDEGARCAVCMQGRHLCISTIGRMRWTIVQAFSRWFHMLFRNSWGSREINSQQR